MCKTYNIVKSDYDILKLIEENPHIHKDEIIANYPERESDINYRLNRIYIPGEIVAEDQEEREFNGFTRSVGINRYIIIGEGFRLIEQYEEKLKKEKYEKIKIYIACFGIVGVLATAYTSFSKISLSNELNWIGSLIKSFFTCF